MTVNANSIVQHVFQINNRIMINANVSAKNIALVKKVILEILAHVIVRPVSI